MNRIVWSYLPSVQQKDKKGSSHLKMQGRGSKFVKFQEIRLQELVFNSAFPLRPPCHFLLHLSATLLISRQTEHVPIGHIPRSMVVPTHILTAVHNPLSLSLSPLNLPRDLRTRRTDAAVYPRRHSDCGRALHSDAVRRTDGTEGGPHRRLVSRCDAHHPPQEELHRLCHHARAARSHRTRPRRRALSLSLIHTHIHALSHSLTRVQNRICMGGWRARLHPRSTAMKT